MANGKPQQSNLIPDTITYNGKQYKRWASGMPCDGHFQVVFIPMDVEQVVHPKTGERFTSLAQFKAGRSGLVYGVDDQNRIVRNAITSTLSEAKGTSKSACPTA